MSRAPSGLIGRSEASALTRAPGNDKSTEQTQTIEQASVYAREQEEGWRRATFEIEQLQTELTKLRAAAMKLDGYWISDTYDSDTKNVTVRLDAFAELCDLLDLKPKTYADE